MTPAQDAAPELLEVCVMIRQHFDYFSEWDLPLMFEQKLDAALAKAGWKPEEEE